MKENPNFLPAFLGLELQRQQRRAQVPSHCFCKKKVSNQNARTTILILSKHKFTILYVKELQKYRKTEDNDST